jgi:preprotein translocase subunit SecY
MNNFFTKLGFIMHDAGIRKRIIFTLGALVIFRTLAAIPIPGIDTSRLAAFFSNNEFFGLLNIFSGGGLSNLSLIMLGVGPFITGSIIMQLLTILSPRLKALYQEEGEIGRRKFQQYSRMLTVPLAAIQGYSFLALLQNQGAIGALSPFDTVFNIVIIIAGSMLLMWIGELINEFGIGNGVSILIFAGIVARLPVSISQFAYTYDPAQLPSYLGILAAAVLVIFGVVVITEAERPIPITYAKRIRGMKVYGGVSTYLPLRLNQAGVIPIIFALSILLFPQMLFQFLSHSNIDVLRMIANKALEFIANPWAYSALYFVLVFAFTYFYTAVTFDPNQMSENLQKSGAFIPGVRPGQSTSHYVARILTRLTLFGASFLGIIAVLPLIIRSLTGITTFTIGGTALLIVVSVVIDLMKKVDAQLSIREY